MQGKTDAKIVRTRCLRFPSHFTGSSEIPPVICRSISNILSHFPAQTFPIQFQNFPVISQPNPFPSHFLAKSISQSVPKFPLHLSLLIPRFPSNFSVSSKMSLSFVDWQISQSFPSQFQDFPVISKQKHFPIRFNISQSFPHPFPCQF